jgi:hypothetical protein
MIDFLFNSAASMAVGSWQYDGHLGQSGLIIHEQAARDLAPVSDSKFFSHHFAVAKTNHGNVPSGFTFTRQYYSETAQEVTYELGCEVGRDDQRCIVWGKGKGTGKLPARKKATSVENVKLPQATKAKANEKQPPATKAKANDKQAQAAKAKTNTQPKTQNKFKSKASTKSNVRSTAARV